MTTDEIRIPFDDRVVAVTGAGGGIGRACALRFARAGARLAVCDRRQEDLDEVTREIAAAGHDPIAHAIDVREPDAIDAFLAEIRDTWGLVDVLVNNAGGTFFASFSELSEKGEATLIAENFTQVTRLIRSVTALMPSGGAIVNVTSIEAHQAAPGFAIYGAMKAALAHLTRTLALELAPKAIRVNAVAPDAIPTAGEGDVRAEMLSDAGAYGPTVLPPLGHMGSPDDAAAVVAFLASDLARFVTGTSIHVDGGNWAAGGWRRATDVTDPADPGD